MDIFEGRYYKSSKFFLQVLGLWPYQAHFIRRISYTIFMVINLSLSIPQGIILAQKAGKDSYVTFENTVSLLFATANLAKYMVTYSSTERLSLLFIQIAKDWQTITDEEERKILLKYYNQAKIMVTFYTVYLFYAWILYTSMPFVPFFLDLLFPLTNGTRPLLEPFYANYVLFDKNNYHYWTCGHIALVYFTSACLYSGVDGAYVLSVKHVCGLFSITCDRAVKAIKLEDNEQSLNFEDDTVVSGHLSKAVVLHNDTIRCCELLEDSFNRLFMIVQINCVIGLAMCGVYVLIIYRETFRSMRVVAFIIGICIHLFYLNFVGQQIINDSEQVFYSVYFSKWYLTSTNLRKFYVLMMCRSLQPCELTAGKISTLSMESFGILIKTATSYFTVLLSFS